MSIRNKSLAAQIFDNIKKTHQAPRCKICNLAFPRLNQRIGICDSCQTNKKQGLDKWLKKYIIKT